MRRMLFLVLNLGLIAGLSGCHCMHGVCDCDTQPLGLGTPSAIPGHAPAAPPVLTPTPLPGPVAPGTLLPGTIVPGTATPLSPEPVPPPKDNEGTKRNNQLRDMQAKPTTSPKPLPPGNAVDIKDKPF